MSIKKMSSGAGSPTRFRGKKKLRGQCAASIGLRAVEKI